MSQTQKWAAIYVRVSTDAQFEEGYSVEAQKQQLEAYCVSKNIKKYKFYVDGGWSGSNIDRPEMQNLIHDVKEDKISHVIVYKLDRLSRSQKDTLYLIEDVFNPHGVDFVSLNESMDTSTPMGRLMLGILSAFAQLERENIRLRTRMGMKERVKSGLWMGGGRVPFGYDYDKEQGVLVPNQDADKVRLIYQMYIDGRAPQDIATTLGLKYDKLVTQILTRKSNYGIIEYNGEEYQGKFTPIITKETYDKAIQCMLERSVKRVTTSEYLLTGLLYCGKCGAKMRYQKWTKRGAKVICYSQQTSKKYLIKDPNCNQPKLWSDEIEDVVIKALLELSSNYTPSETEEEATVDLLQMMYNQKNELTKKIKSLYTLYAEDEDKLLLETINELKNKLDILNKKIKREEENSTITIRRKEKAQILATLKDLWEHMTFQEKRNIIHTLVDKVTITDNHIDIEFSI